MNTVNLASNRSTINQIIDLRFEVLRKPWNQPIETATDNFEESSINAYIEESGKIIACGRLQINNENVGLIRYMAVHPNYQGRGLGKMIVNKLESEAKLLHINRIELQARENAVQFYQSQNYVLKEKSFKLWDIIQHYLMIKEL